MAKIINVGSLNMDLVISTPRVPVMGETILGSNFMTSPGGKGANQAVASARLGGSVVMIGCTGNDIFGEDLIENLKANNINVDNVEKLKEIPTGIAVILLKDGDNCIIVDPGANYRITDDNIKCLEEIAQSGDILITQLEVPIDAVLKALKIAKKKGVKTILNPAPAKTLTDEIYTLVDVITPNESECELLSGIKFDTPGSIEKSIHFFREKGVGQIIITLGKNGVVYNKGDGIIHKPVPKVDAVDTTAAGDSFSGALAVCLAQGMAIDEAIDFCNKVGVLTVMKKGAQSSLPYIKDVENFTCVMGRR